MGSRPLGALAVGRAPRGSPGAEVGDGKAATNSIARPQLSSDPSTDRDIPQPSMKSRRPTEGLTTDGPTDAARPRLAGAHPAIVSEASLPSSCC